MILDEGRAVSFIWTGLAIGVTLTGVIPSFQRVFLEWRSVVSIICASRQACAKQKRRWPSVGTLLLTLLPTTTFAVHGCKARVSTGDPRWETQRRQMVDEQIVARGVQSADVLAVMGRVPRHEFVPEALRGRAYQDCPLPIGEGQTISQPYIVAFMTESIHPQPGQRVLEIGTGSGYQAAVLSELVGEVYTIELLPTLADEARSRLERLGYHNVHLRRGDGFYGWPEEAPFDAVVVTCGADQVPPVLFEQLVNGGKMVIPVGPGAGVQRLQLVEKGPRGEKRTRELLPVRFVPLRHSGS